MELAYLDVLPCGNAVRLMLNPQGSASWRVLRNETGAFVGPVDPASFLVYEGDSRYVSDFRGLVNGVLYHYAVYGADGAGQPFGVAAFGSATPAVSFEDDSVDVQEVVRERIEGTLAGMIAGGQLTLTNTSIPVLSIPFYGKDTPLPVVTVLLSTDSSGDRFVGEQETADVKSGEFWESTDGWLSRVVLDIAVWCLNGEERNRLRNAMKACLVANLPVFEDAGMVQVDVTLRDQEDFDSLEAPVYKTLGTLTCMAPAGVLTRRGPIESVVTNRN